MISDKQIVCPNNLLDAASKKKGVSAAIVNAGKPLPMLSVMDAVKENLIKPKTKIGLNSLLKLIENINVRFLKKKYNQIHFYYYLYSTFY